MKKLFAFRALIWALVALAVVFGVFIAQLHKDDSDIGTTNPTSTTSAVQQTFTVDDIIKQNISGFSNEAGYPEVLGGHFYVTKIEERGGAGTVYYEDGHNAYVADFKYIVDEKGIAYITSFTVRK